jgi:hypothetical protein
VEGKDWDRNSLINHGVGGAKPRVLPRLSVVLFFFSPLVGGQALKEKETKSSSEFDAESHLGKKFPMTNSRWEEALESKGLRLETSLRVSRRFLKALYFSLRAFSYLMLLFSEK